MRPYERMIDYCRIHTTSDESSESTPSAFREFTLADLLADELRALGVSDVRRTDTCNVYGKIPATPGYESAPKIGFVAHLDTAPDFCGENVRPLIWENYDGNDIPLPECGRVIRVSDFPYLKEKKGKTLITASGDTLLGADDKAGIAEIVCMCERLLKGGIPHGPVRIAFTPDEEIGMGTATFDYEAMDADYAYTMDGAAVGEVVWECFNAASASVTVSGNNVHPGSAKGIMVNACLVAMEFNALLPANEIPSETEGYEGFYHLTGMKGAVEQADLQYILRDHDSAKLAEREERVREAAEEIDRRYGSGTVQVSFREGYRNMADAIRSRFEVVEKALTATRKAGLEPIQDPIRGGTDGATMTAAGLPCPNLGTGSYAFHGPYEHSVAEEMDLAVEIMLGILTEFIG